MLVSLFFHLSLELKESELPSCSQVRKVNYFKSEVIRRRIAPGSSFCIAGTNTGVYKGNLAFVFNKLSGINPILYYTTTNSTSWIEVKGTSEAGGAATGRYPGFIYFKNNGTEKVEINVAYTTFLNDCDDSFISSMSEEEITLTDKIISKKYCYFNGINGRHEIEL